jgi:hypothetical protein
MRYDPALLILTWEDETLAEVTMRVGRSIKFRFSYDKMADKLSSVSRSSFRTSKGSRFCRSSTPRTSIWPSLLCFERSFRICLSSRRSSFA